MTPLTASIWGAIICGIVMVIGGIVLLYKGAIDLAVASADPALTVDIFNEKFRLTTRFPAIGLFVLGLLFTGLSLWVAKSADIQSIWIVGEVENVDEPITVSARAQWPIFAPQPQLNDVLRPSLDVLWIRIEAPGFQPVEKSFT